MVSLVLSCLFANPVAFVSLHMRCFDCASWTSDIHDLVVHGILQWRQFKLICGTLMSMNVFDPGLIGFNSGHCVLRVELACFLSVFVLLGLMQA